ncbi:GTP pyrophosphokinase [Paenibacillus arenilitoris]|uniref:GTP pyrophosphokinase family protein n=1 Tax=Paenibacillus arenilitoris TaxID=2772299 RepID=A0A927CG20_9BACL|nr:GTP pyrophosphokinase family protein [Paenibacillus arenilitoris]MBD2867419.1 GTP pyrophosphokinase family protein [Paenibacillus arenilitoris]
MAINNQMQVMKQMKQELTRFMMLYKFALQELETKIEILQEEFQLLHDYNPIEHTASRLKSPQSIAEKLFRKQHELSLTSIKQNIKDIAGLRITCSFVSDIYRISDMLTGQSDLRTLEVKDYIKEPKPNGYQSLHLLVEVPVFMSDRTEHVCVEVQIRTIAMDFWASLEHKIFYKYKKEVPLHLLRELKEAADSASALDRKMERLQKEIEAIKEEQEDEGGDELVGLLLRQQNLSLPPALLGLFEDDRQK